MGTKSSYLFFAIALSATGCPALDPASDRPDAAAPGEPSTGRPGSADARSGGRGGVSGSEQRGNGGRNGDPKAGTAGEAGSRGGGGETGSAGRPGGSSVSGGRTGGGGGSANGDVSGGGGRTGQGGQNGAADSGSFGANVGTSGAGGSTDVEMSGGAGGRGGTGGVGTEVPAEGPGSVDPAPGDTGQLQERKSWTGKWFGEARHSYRVLVDPSTFRYEDREEAIALTIEVDDFDRDDTAAGYASVTARLSAATCVLTASIQATVFFGDSISIVEAPLLSGTGGGLDKAGRNVALTLTGRRLGSTLLGKIAFESESQPPAPCNGQELPITLSHSSQGQ
jgi:hypothetical protein